MLVFGTTGFAMAYGPKQPDVWFLFMHGGGAITCYVAFYLGAFGVDEVKWMFINAGLGIAGIYTQVDWLLKRFDRDIAVVPWYVHVVPFTYYVLYVFLVRNAFLDLFGARANPARRATADKAYVAASLAICLMFFLLDR